MKLRLNIFRKLIEFLKPKMSEKVDEIERVGEIRQKDLKSELIEHIEVEVDYVEKERESREIQIKELNEEKSTLSEDRELSEHEVVIGFDLGTSCSKVVIRDPHLKNAYAVDFAELGYIKNTFLLPTKIYYKNDGTFNLLNGDIVIDDIKLKLIDYSNKYAVKDITYTEVTIAYLSIAFSIIRDWFYQNLGYIYSDKKILWRINIGMPARDFSDNMLVSLFRFVALIGWEISFDKNLSIDTIKSRINNMKSIEDVNPVESLIHPDFVNAFPEIIAGVIGYTKSRMRRDGMYLLVDIGASTVDVSMFNLFRRDGETKYSILWADIKRLGVHILFQNRLKLLPSEAKLIVEKNYKQDEFIGPMLNLYNIIPDQYIHYLQSADNDFSKLFRSLVGNVVLKVKKEQNPNAPEWKSGVPVFMTGGGSGLDLFHNGIESAFSFINNCGIEDPEFKKLPLPPDLNIPNQPPSIILRFNIAYGLSFRETDIGEIRAHETIEAISKYEFPVDYSYRYTSKEMT